MLVWRSFSHLALVRVRAMRPAPTKGSMSTSVGASVRNWEADILLQYLQDVQFNHLLIHHDIVEQSAGIRNRHD